MNINKIDSAIQPKVTTKSSSDSTQQLLETGSVFTPSDSTLDDIVRGNGFGALSQALTSSLYGIDLTGKGSPAQAARENYGLTFFVRPLLNLSHYNLKADRSLSIMANKNKTSVGAYVRSILDPIGGHLCPLVNYRSAFIPILSNTCESISGWQDPIISTFQSHEGKLGSQYSLVNSTNKVYKVFQLSSSFRNLRGNVLPYLFYVWQTYMGLLAYGKVERYPEFVAKNVIDYQTRIYRLILDPTRQFVEEVIAPHACFPLQSTAGSRGNYNRSENYNGEFDMIPQTWECQGVRYYDPLNFKEFNQVSEVFDPRFEAATREQYFRRLWPVEYKLFNYWAVPRIDEKTSRLEWWVTKDKHREILGADSDTYEQF